MTTFDTCETASHATGWTAVVKAAVATVDKASNLFRAWQNRREMYRLGAMSDVELADIGLTRGDLFEARNTPVHLDPTARLGAFSELNRRQAAARCIS
jgi:uncharacterized protein YjiS (DUF1127 family)